MNLINGRNLGELPGLRIYTAPKRSDKSRMNDVLIMIITIDEKSTKIKDFEEWGAILSEAYFNARGSFTMGITAAVKQFSVYLNEKFPGVLLPNVLLNLAVLRGRTMMIGHSGPVNTTVVYADHVDNFSDITSLGVSQGTQGLRFFQIEIHSGDLILMCPKVPYGWTNEAILDATGESPLNVIRYLLDQAHGSLQGVVIQVKAGRGEILYRFKPPITTNVSLGYHDEEDETSGRESVVPPVRAADLSASLSAAEQPARSDYLLGSDDEKSKLLFRTRLPFEPFPVDFNPHNKMTFGTAGKFEEATEVPSPEEPAVEAEKPAENELPAFLSSYPVKPDASDESGKSFSSEAEYAFSEPLNDLKKKSEPLADNLPFEDLSDLLSQSVTAREGESGSGTDAQQKTLIEPTPPAKESPVTKRDRKERVRQKAAKGKKQEGKNPGKSEKKPFSWKRFLLGLFFGILIPIIVVTVLFLDYTHRSKDTVYRDTLGNAVDTAKIAVQQTEPSLQRISWEKVLEYLDEAALYGTSDAARGLRNQALESLDKLDNGTLVPYHYALSGTLPSGTNLTRIESTDQFLFALDKTSGSVMRFNIYSNGMIKDETFSCSPGSYKDNQSTTSSDLIQVEKLVDFVILPQESGKDRVVLGIDNNARLLYCPSIGEKTAAQLESPEMGWLGVEALYFANRTLYILDARNNSIRGTPYLGNTGVSVATSSYFGSSSPGVRDVTDFVIYGANSYFLRTNGTLIVCDYTGYTPVCSYVDQLVFSESGQEIDLTLKNYFQINMNMSPDTSLYLMDSHSQSVLNVTLKLNLIRNSVPDRFEGEGSDRSVTGFGFLDQFQLVWTSSDQIFIGALK